MEIAGYQSDIKQQIINTTVEDTFTAEKNIAEFGITTGEVDNKYNLSLTPKLTKAYEKGLRLQVVFHKPNTGAITLNVDGKGEIPVVKLTALCSTDDPTGDIPIGEVPIGGGDSADRVLIPKQESTEKGAIAKEREGLLLEPTKAGDIAIGVHYILVFDGERFQVVNHIPLCTPSNPTGGTPPTENELFFNRQEYFTIGEDHVDPRIELNPGRNRYAAINGNLIVARDIRFKRTGGPGKLFGARIKFPKPLDPNVSNTPGFVQSLEGDTFFYRMGSDGVIQVQGELVGVNDEINLNFYPYIAKFPLEFDTKLDFSTIEVPNAKVETPEVTPKVAKSKSKPTTKPKPKTK